jgi:protein-tyrosine phosphatase
MDKEMTKPKSFLIKNVKVEQIKKGKYKIRWESEGNGIGVDIFTGDSPQTINRKTKIAKVRGNTSVEVDDLDGDVRHYFEVVPEGGPGIVAADRHQPFEGIVNFRDLGGYETTDGRRLKWGQVFRSGHLSRVTEKDKVLIGRMGIKLICDFRSQGEFEAQPNWLPADGSISYLQYPIVHGEFDPVAAMESLRKGDISWLTEDFIIDRYIQKIEKFPKVWGEIIEMTADPDKRPLVFHCTAGKDRAGTCAAILLLALGVPEDTVIYDHGLSNVYIADALKTINERIRSLGIDPQKVAPYFTAPRNAIIAVVEHIRNTYGSAEAYLKTKAGMGNDIFKALKQQLMV